MRMVLRMKWRTFRPHRGDSLRMDVCDKVRQRLRMRWLGALSAVLPKRCDTPCLAQGGPKLRNICMTVRCRSADCRWQTTSDRHARNAPKPSPQQHPPIKSISNQDGGNKHNIMASALSAIHIFAKHFIFRPVCQTFHFSPSFIVKMAQYRGSKFTSPLIFSSVSEFVLLSGERKGKQKKTYKIRGFGLYLGFQNQNMTN